MSGRSVSRRVLDQVAPRLGGAMVNALLRTTRHELIAGEKQDLDIVGPRLPAIYVLWHGRLLPCAYAYRNFGFGTLISHNRDGDYVTRMIEGWGYRVIRGSSSRGSSGAQLAIVRALREGTPVALTPDGPRGPRQKMKMGPLRAAQKAGVPIVPVSAGASAAWYFGKWDRFLVPKPFSWIPIALGTPFWLDPGAATPDLERMLRTIEAELDRITSLVDEAARVGRR